MKNQKMKTSILSFLIYLSCALPLVTFAQQTAVVTGDVQPCPLVQTTYAVSFPTIPDGYVLDRIEWQVYSVNPIITNSPTVTVTIPNDASKRTTTIVATVYKKSTTLNNFSVIHSYGQLVITARAYSPKFSIPGTIEYSCGVQQISVSVSDYPTSQASFNWSVPSGWSILSGQNTPTIQVQTSAGSGGQIALEVVDNKCGNQYFDGLLSTVTRTPVPPLGSISGGAGCFCSGQTQSFSVPAVSGATSYQWAGSGSLYIASGQGTSTVSVGSNGSGGSITCYAVTPCGNTNTVSSNYIFTSSGAPPTPNITVTTTPCTNYRRAGLLTITNSDPCATYYWSASSGVIIDGGNPNASVEIASGANYAYVYGVNACGSSATGSRVIPIDTQCFGPYLAVALRLIAAPNPFSDRTTLSYTLAEDAQVMLEVSTPVGKRIATLVNDRQKAGDHDTVFDASRLSTGVYMATLTVTTKSGDRQTASVQLTVTR